VVCLQAITCTYHGSNRPLAISQLMAQQVGITGQEIGTWAELEMAALAVGITCAQ
jgi:hypothetical protein